MPTISQLTCSLNELLQTGKWQETDFFGCAKKLSSSRIITFTPLLSAHYLSQCTHDLQITHLAQQIFDNLAESSPYQQWNYHYGFHIYPNDLDDTIIAATISLKTNRLQKTTVIAEIIRNLIAVEVNPGGPYRTWFTNEDDPKWGQDVDFIVNYRVQNFLHQLDIHLPNLTSWLNKQANKQITSPYYTVFENNLVRSAVLNTWQWQKLQPNNPYEIALLIITALQHNKHTPREIYSYYRRLVDLPIDALKAEPAFLDQVKKCKQKWAGSVLLTQSACLSAISLFQQRLIDDNTLLTKQSIEKNINTKLRKTIIFAPELSSLVEKKLTKLSSIDNSPALHYISEQLVQHAQQDKNHAASIHVAVATILGWIAYTNHDEYIDSQDRNDNRHMVIASRLLTILSQEVFLKCCKALPSECRHAAESFINTVFLKMEASYFFDSSSKPSDTPMQGWENHIYQRGAGLLIAPILLHLFEHPNADLTLLQKVGKLLVIARQLLDDIHDFSSDLKHHRTTFITSLIYTNGLSANPTVTHLQHSQLFAHTTNKINTYLRSAQKLITQLPHNSQHIFLPELVRLQSVLNQQETTLMVINAFAKNTNAQTIPSPPPHTTSNRPTAMACSSQVESRSTG